ncbi:hypothetical protein C8A05DRAFT_13607 [Staphylotrichum tortipilum]|uniref:Chromo domain-containing protein n=1 Tax=Staphylotrichum tortipilum TaxID=2831512 RepID=A0AAN6MP52_9PEZI|nr:hypothetical protein C8A05DRAFT_13607 [Staphylotrichum longicolle]
MPDNGIPPPTGRKTTIEIPLHSIRKYVPGSGPPPPAISLLPPRDSTAYIIDQFVLPADKDMTPTSRRLIHYHIGFTDLPAVKILIPCNQVLDYVSPRELEDWEYRNLEKKEEEQARLLAEKERAGPPKKKPGHPPKVPMEDLGNPVSPADETLHLAQEVAGRSLSTPQKQRLDRVPDSEGTEDTSNPESDDAAIQQQLRGVADLEVMDSGGEDDDEVEFESDDAHHLAPQYDTSPVAIPLRAGSLIPPRKGSLPAASVPSPSTIPFPSAVPAPTARPPSNTPTPVKVHPAWAHQLDQTSHPDKPTTKHGQNGHSKQTGTPWPLLNKSQHTKPFTPTAAPTSSFKPAGGSKGPSTQFLGVGAGTGSSIASDSLMTKRKNEHTNRQTPSPDKQPKTKKQKIKQEDPPPAEEWEVKDLLDDQWFDDQGVRVHKYLILWAGDWPEDQNPTWEPAENVQNKALIQRYHKKKKAGTLKPPKKTQKTLHHFLAGARYSSVAEALEGDMNDQSELGAGVRNAAESADERFLVTETVGDITSNRSRPAPTSNLLSFDSMLARYTKSFSHG